ncbi:MAG: S41 family peptidase [Muribaculaceae bacterium]|nr:S41 family peptidase [Muribaculaceae bacterium]
MRRLIDKLPALFLASSAVCMGLTGCEGEEYADDPRGNFEALWEIVDTRYCFFEEKGIDWEAVGKKYRSRVKPDMSDMALFSLCSEMLSELRDGHVNLVSSFDTYYYRAWWTDYPQDFNLRTLQQYYLGFDYGQTSGISYKMMPDSIGYMYYPSFSSGIGNLNLDYILAILYKSKGLVLDVRNNGGGLLTNVETLVSRFTDTPVSGGYITHKTGPGHDDFSEPFSFTYSPADARRVSWNGTPVVVLTNRSCFSAANDFVAVMKSLPGVAVMGARTGGGGGLPFSSELPNGWAVRLSASPISGPGGEFIEFGVDPTPGCEVTSSDIQLARGTDHILDTALSLLERLAANKEERDLFMRDKEEYFRVYGL